MATIFTTHKAFKHLEITFERDNTPISTRIGPVESRLDAVIVAETDFTERPLYMYAEPRQAATEFRAIAEWLETLEVPEG